MFVRVRTGCRPAISDVVRTAIIFVSSYQVNSEPGGISKEMCFGRLLSQKKARHRGCRASFAIWYRRGEALMLNS